MKFDLGLRENDKKALTVLIIFFIIVIPLWFLLRPAVIHNGELKAELEAAKVKQTAVENNILKYNAGIGGAKTAEEEFKLAASEAYPYTSANEIDRRITEKAYSCGLSVTDSKTERHSEPIEIAPYAHSKMYEEQEESGDGVTAAVYCCDYSINVTGSKEGIYAFMDALAEEGTGCVVKEYTLFDNEAGSCGLNAEVSFYMAE